MVKITEKLIRKKSEHNELIISTLEEISLHQEDIEKIEYIQDTCRNLKILLLQSNLIAKIENLHKLKYLEYLNLALNNIEVIENLDKLENLNKLDLTLNFIGNLRSISNLKQNYNLKELHLLGNPCADFPGYRTYVIANLPQLNKFDGNDITLSDKLAANKDYKSFLDIIKKSEINYNIQRSEQRVRVAFQKETLSKKLESVEDDDEKNKLFWNTTTENCPEARIDIALQHRKGKHQSDDQKSNKPKHTPKLFAASGRPYNINQSKLDFKFSDEENEFSLCLHIFKYIDTELLTVDIATNYVRVYVKGKIFQLALNEEIDIGNCETQRSQLTGHLLIVMPKLKHNIETLKFKSRTAETKIKSNAKSTTSIDDKLTDMPDLI